MPRPRPLSVCAILLPALFATLTAGMRYGELARTLELRGLARPTGAGVPVTQVEAREDTDRNGSTDADEGYAPDTGNAEFTGKSVRLRSATGLNPSGHATTVGRFLYGRETGLAPGITDIDVYEAWDWLSNRGWGGGTPETEPNPLQNHSWVGDRSTADATLRMDFAAVRDGFLPVAGLKNNFNDGGDTVPVIYGAVYNGLAVGRSDGNHRAGTTPDADGPGRTKPEIVAPESTTSWATAQVTAAAALLIESAGADTTAARPLVLKATLLAGADKSPFSGWAQTTERPIDAVFGAGQLDVYANHFIQAAGRQAEGGVIGARGWNRAALPDGATHTYTLDVPPGFEARDLSVVVTWHRQVTREETGFGPFSRTVYTPNVANLALELRDPGGNLIARSDSTVDNLEHIWRGGAEAALPEGTHALVITGDHAADYAIAWRATLWQDYPLWSASAFPENVLPSDRDPEDDPDNDGMANRLEQAFGGDPATADAAAHRPALRTVPEDGKHYLEITYRHPTFANGLDYRVETATHPEGPWSDDPADVAEVARVADGGRFEERTFRRTASVETGTRGFLRVTVATDDGT